MGLKKKLKRISATALAIITAVTMVPVIQKPVTAKAATKQTVESFLGYKRADLVNWLKSHESDTYYLGTHYVGLPMWTPDTNAAANVYLRPKGDAGGNSPQMNCTGFVAHATRHVGADLSKIDTTYGSSAAGGYFGGSYANAANWSTTFNYQEGVTAYVYDSPQALLNGGHAKKGDIIFIRPNNDPNPNADCHIGFFWGDTPSENKFWHSASAGTHKVYAADRTTVLYSVTLSDGNQITKLVPKCTYAQYILWTTDTTSLTVIKKDDTDNTPLAGAVFKVYETQADATNNTNAICTTAASNANGKIVINDLNVGKTYYLRESVAPDGYKKSTTVYSTGTLKENPVENEKIITNELKTVALTVIKKDATDNTPLAGAVFKVYETQANATNNTKAIRTTAASNANGKIVIDDLKVGKTYYLRESVAPAGYKKSTTVYSTGTLKENPVENEKIITNEPKKVSLTVIKKDNLTNTPLAGAVFKVYETQADATNNTNAIRTTAASNANGKITIANLIVGKNYFLRESVAPAGYIKSTTVYSTGTLKEDPVENEKIITNEPKKVSFTVVKKDSTNDKVLAGAVFNLYKTQADAEKDTNAVLTTAASDANGKIVISNLIVGNVYYLKEITAPAGYIKSTEVFSTDTLNEKPVENEKIIKNKPKTGNIYIMKHDKNNTGLMVAGAEYTIYTDADCTKIAASHKDGIQQVLTTNAAGIAKSADLDEGTYYIKETKTPAPEDNNGVEYKLSLEKTSANVVYGENVPVMYTVVGEERLYPPVYGRITISKTDSLTSDVVNGAQFGVYADKECTIPVKYAYDTGYVELDNAANYDKPVVLTTGKDGIATTDKLMFREGQTRTYYVKEIKTGTVDKNGITYEYNMLDKVFPVTLVKDTTVKVNNGDVTNEPVMGKITVVKSGADFGQPVEGATYTIKYAEDVKKVDGTVIYTKGSVADTLVTKADGTATSRELYPGYYTVQETGQALNFMLNKDVKNITLEPGADYKCSEIETPVVGSISIHKLTTFENVQDGVANVDKAVGDGTLEGAVYDIYAAEDIYSAPSKKVYSKGDKVATLPATDAYGRATLSADTSKAPWRFYVGKYELKESVAPTGYKIDKNVYPVEITLNDANKDLAVDVSKDVPETPISASFSITKTLLPNDIKEQLQVLKPEVGAQFQVYLKKNGSYDASPEYERDIVTIDEKGNGTTKKLPYGVYVVHQIAGDKNYMFAADFTAPCNVVEELKDSFKDGETYHYNLTNPQYVSQVRIQKVDSETGKVIKLGGVKFKIFNEETGGKPIAVGVRKQTVFTTLQGDDPSTENIEEAGTLMLPDYLKPGQYYLEEIAGTAPYGYLLAEKRVPFVISVDTTTSEEDNMPMTEIRFADKPVKGKIEITKTGEVLDSYTDGKFVYKDAALSGVTFEVSASEDIFTPDFQTDADGNRNVLYKAGDVVGTITTDTDGKASLGNLPLGSYKLTETKTVAGFVLNAEPIVLKISYADETTPVVVAAQPIENQRQRFNLVINKTDSVSKNPLANAKFEVKALSDVKNFKGEVIVKEGTVVETLTTNEEGKAVSTCDLPYAIYSAYKQGEIEQPEKPEIPKADATIAAVSAKADVAGRNLVTYTITNKGVDLKNLVVNLGISAEELTNAIFKLEDGTVLTLNEDGTLTVPSVKGEADTKVMAEVDATVTLSDCSILSSVIGIQVPYTTTTMEVNAEEPTKMDVVETTVDLVTGDVISTETKQTVNLSRVLFSVKEAEAPNGYYMDETENFIDGELPNNTIEMVAKSLDVENTPTETVIKKTDLTGVEELEGATLTVTDADGNKVDEWVSDGTSHTIYALEIGKTYTLTETAPASGYTTAESIEFTILGDGTATEVTMKDAPTVVEVSKQSFTDAKEITGATLTITDAEGKEVVSWVTDGTPKQIEKLPIGKYTLTETVAAPGYATAEKVEFEVTDTMEIQKVVMKDKPLTVEISKQTFTDAKELPGATLTITDADGNEVVTWITDGAPKKIENIPVGTYTLTETSAPSGYATAEKVEFTVTDTMEIQKVVMKDKPLTVEISKQTFTDAKELPGATLQIKDANGKKVAEWITGKKPYTIEKLPAGEYTLIETSAPSGYATAEKVAFTVKDTGEIQKVVMKDKPLTVEISKTDITDGKELPGATLQIKDENGKVVEEWVSGDKPHTVEQLPEGKYTLTEITAPDGYSTAETVEFTVEDTMEIQKVEMKDSPIKVQISKQDITNGKELPGAKLEIIDSKGNTVESWVSTDEAHMIEKLPVGNYVLREITAPDGYEVAEDVAFTVKDTAEIQHVVMQDSPKKTEQVVVAPQTGNGVSALPAVFAIILLIGVVAAVLLLKKKSKKEPTK